MSKTCSALEEPIHDVLELTVKWKTNMAEPSPDPESYQIRLEYHEIIKKMVLDIVSQLKNADDFCSEIRFVRYTNEISFVTK